MSKFLIVVVFIFATAFIFLYIGGIFQKDEIEKYLKKWQIDIDTTELAFENFSKGKTKFFEKEKLEIRREGIIVRITKVKTSSPRKYAEDKKFLLESLFSQTAAPYPGVITNVIECPEEFKPKIVEAENGTMYTFFAGERFTYGICTQDLIVYYSTYGIFECKNDIFEVNVFSEKEGEEPERIVESFHC